VSKTHYYWFFCFLLCAIDLPRVDAQSDNQPLFSPSPISTTTSAGTQLKKQIPSSGAPKFC